MLAFLRRNTIAILALFIALGGTAYAANTVRSSDIVDGTIQTQDLHDSAVTPQKTAGVWLYHYTETQQTSQCVQPGVWYACASTQLAVPGGHEFIVTVISTVNADPGTTTQAALYCAADTGPTCMNGGPDFATFQARSVTSASTASVLRLSGGSGGQTYTFSTAVKFPGSLLADPDAHTTTTIIANDATNGNPQYTPAALPHTGRATSPRDLTP